MNQVSSFKAGDRVQMHPATDLWMRGARFGTVVRTLPVKNLVRVQLDAGGKLVSVHPSNLLFV